MNKTELAKLVGQKVELAPKHVLLLFAAIEEALLEGLRQDAEVCGPGARWVVVPMKARLGRNPATGEQIKIAARAAVRSKPSKLLKDAFAKKKVKPPVPPKPTAKKK